MESSQRVLFRDSDFNISSKFIVEVSETSNVIALYPSQIERKCVCLFLDSKTYFCPYHIVFLGTKYHSSCKLDCKYMYSGTD